MLGTKEFSSKMTLQISFFLPKYDDNTISMNSSKIKCIKLKSTTPSMQKFTISSGCFPSTGSTISRQVLSSLYNWYFSTLPREFVEVLQHNRANIVNHQIITKDNGKVQLLTKWYQTKLYRLDHYSVFVFTEVIKNCPSYWPGGCPAGTSTETHIDVVYL